MARSRQFDANPSYRLHRQSGQAIVSIPRGDGTYKDYLLGTYRSSESKDEYNRVIAEWRASGCRLPAGELPGDLTIAELLVQYEQHCETYYRDPDGQPSAHLDRNIKPALKPLKKLYPHLVAHDFGPLKLKACRDWFVTQGFKRQYINKCTSMIKQFFSWATSEELLPGTIAYALREVKGLRRGKCEAKEYNELTPVDPALVAKILPVLNDHVRGIVSVMLHSGARTGEICLMRPIDIDRNGPIWRYTPRRHKCEQHGKTRVIPLGPRAQEIIKPFLDDIGAEDYVFSPKRMQETRFAEMRKKRKTPVQPSQQNRAVRRRRKPLGIKYNPNVIQHAVNRACDRAGVDRFRVYRLRHTAGTKAREIGGLDGAQALLGHSKLMTTQVYAARRDQLAAEIASMMG